MAAEDASDLFSELSRDQDPRRSQTCKWQLALAQIPNEANDFIEAIEKGQYTLASIQRALDRRGVQVARNSLERHRRGQCQICR